MDISASNVTDTALNALRTLPRTGSKLPTNDQTATDFEGMVLGQMLSSMWEGVEVDDMFGGGTGEEIFRGMMIQEYGKQISAMGGLGIADAVKKQLLSIQENASL